MRLRRRTGRNGCRHAAAWTIAIVLGPLAGADEAEPLAAARPWTVLETAVERAPGVVRAQRLDVDRAALANAREGDRVVLELFDGRTVTGMIERRAERAPDRFTLTGRLETELPNAFQLAVRGTGLSGVVRAGPGGTHRVRGAADGSLALESIDEAAVPWCGLEDEQRFDAGAGPAPEPRPGDVALLDDGSVIDLLVVYTSQARAAAGGTANILAEIDLMVANMNTAFENSAVEPRMHLVYAREIATPQNDINLGNLTGRGDGVADGVHDLRDAYGADQVALVVSGGGGVANGLRNLEPEQEALMFCINGRNSMPFIVAHEVGHNLGCCHALGDGGGCGRGLLFPFSNGYRFRGDSNNLWRTVMAYSPGIWSALYSNPRVEFDGVPMGVDAEREDGADNVLTINIAAPVVANWRCGNPTCELLDIAPDAPDCDGDEVPDACAIALGLGTDADLDGIPDQCQVCVADVDGDGNVGFGDLVAILAAWGNEGGPEDVDGSGVVDFGDVVLLLSSWGPCFAPTGACCFDDGTCADATRPACDREGGSYAGDGTRCDDVCPVGACCFPGGGCTGGTLEDCAQAGGVFQGGGTSCFPAGARCVGGCLPADFCEDAPIVSDGAYPYSTLNATTDGPLLPESCDEGNGPWFRSDVWVRYQAPCDGIATVSICDGSYDNRLAVYEADDCPGAVVACSDDACGEGGTRSQATFAVTQGERFLIRVGGALDVGEGLLVVTCDGGGQ